MNDSVAERPFVSAASASSDASAPCPRIHERARHGATRGDARRLFDDPFFDDPYPTYHALREAAPLQWSGEFFGGAWLLSRFEDVEWMLRDTRMSARRTGGWVMGSAPGARDELKALQRLFGRAMLFTDGADHQRLRRVLGAGLRADAMRAWAPDIEALLEELLIGVDVERGFDFMQCIARPLPARVIARLMGIEGDVLASFIVWSEDLSTFIGAPRPTLDQAWRAQSSLLGMSRYFERLIAHGTVRRGSLLDSMMQAVIDGKIEDGPELLAQCTMLLFAGHETTRNLLGNGLYHLLSRPDLWSALRREPQRLRGAIRELLRFDSPVQYTGRRVAIDIELHGRTLRRGDLVIGLIGAANRDPRRFAKPDWIDLARADPGTLSFGTGPHVCIGAALTLVEAEVVFRYLLERWPQLQLVNGYPEWRRNALYRGLSTLEIRPRDGETHGSEREAN